MAHTKAGGSTRQKGNRSGKRLGIKLYGGQKVVSGNIIIRQKGSTFHAGNGVKMGKDYSLFAIRDGIVKFLIRQGRKLISVE